MRGVGDLINILISKGLDYLMAQLPSLISRREVSREDTMLVLLYAMASDIKALREDMKALREDMKVLRDEVRALSGKVDVLNNKIDELSGKIDMLSGKVYSLGGRIDDLRKDVVGRLDYVSNLLQSLNSNIASTYELTSRVMAKLMELYTRYQPAHATQ
ncbi:coiled-coil domain-containing protein [Vulcanisaeta sp.]|uniref:coiled-coil domain-containing protein n=1 Tax=Vulcanisaeta sp. TaxID=2020871 RepID=UPI003D0D2D22